MATALYLETFLENIESLPRDFQRNFALIKDLDTRVQGLEEEIKVLSASYEKEVRKLSEEDKKANLCRIQEKIDKMKEYSDDKVQLAVQMYEMVDKHIRRLDGDLARFEAEIHMKENEKRKESILTDLDIEDHPDPSSDSVAKTGRRKSSRGQLPKPSGITTPPPLGTFTDPAHDVLDMPVDPNEPTYCLCHQMDGQYMKSSIENVRKDSLLSLLFTYLPNVSFGEMIGCDNSDCPIEWFHFQCVGLTAKPKGKWYCPICYDEMEKHK